MAIAIEELEKRVNARKEYITAVINFVKDLLIKEGAIIKCDERDDHTHMVREIKDFDGFYISYSSGESMTGGETITIKKSGLTLLIARYQSGIEDCEVRVFSDGGWESTFARVMEDKDKIIERMREEKEAETKKTVEQLNLEKKREKLLEEARRLGL